MTMKLEDFLVSLQLLTMIDICTFVIEEENTRECGNNLFLFDLQTERMIEEQNTRM